MDNSRLLLWLSFGLVCFLLWEAWVRDYGPTRAPGAPAPIAEQAPAAAEDDVPSLDEPVAASEPASAAVPAVSAAPAGERIRVVTDLLEVEIDTIGAELASARLPNYPVHKDQPDVPVQLLDADVNFVVQAGLLGRDAPAPDHRSRFLAAQTEYTLEPGQEQIDVVLSWSEGDVKAIRVYTFHRGSYRIDVAQSIEAGAQPWSGASYVQIRREQTKRERSFFDVDSYSFTGPLYFDGEKYEKFNLKDLRKRPLDSSAVSGWIASVQHHFVTAAVPPADESVRYRSRLQSGNIALLSAVGEAVTVAPGQRGEFRHTLWIGPKTQEQLRAIAPKLNKVVDYGLLAILSEPLFWFLGLIHGVVGNWGWAIILLTIAIKLVFYKLTETSGRSMAKMRELQPRIKAMQERYKDDRQQLSQAMMELYKREGANPLSGCLPILIQMPVFLALYWVLIESVELRQAPWMLWIQDLSVRDPFFILPILMGITMVAQQRLNPAPPDPIQARVAQILPIVMTVFFAFFPAGLVLYWFVNTLLSVAQQWHINRVIARGG